MKGPNRCRNHTTNRRRPLLLVEAALCAVIIGSGLVPQASAPVGFLVLACVLVALGTAGRRTAVCLIPDAGPASRLVAGFTVAVAIATVPATLLGHFGILRPELWLFSVGSLCFASRLLPTPPSAASPPTAPDTTGPWRTIEGGLLIVMLAALVLSTLYHLSEARFLIPGSFQYDDISFHLPAAATWLQTHDLSMMKFSFGDKSTPFYPILGELVSWCLIAPLRISDFAARWSQLPFALATLAALAAVGRRLGMSIPSVIVGCSLFWSLARVFPILALGAGNDHATSFFTIATIDGLLLVARRPTPGRAIYLGLTTGFLAGTKYLGLMNLCILGVVFLICVVGQRTQWRQQVRPLGLALPLAGITAALVGGYTYLRNFVTTGNPVFPAPISVGGFEVFPGWSNAALTARRHAPEFAIELPDFLFRYDLFGPIAPWLLPLAAVVAPLLALGITVFRKRRIADGLEAAAVLVLPLAFFAEFLFLTHDHRDIRYFLGGVAIAALAVGWLSDRIADRWGAVGSAFRTMISLAILFLVILSHCRKPGEIATGFAVITLALVLAMWRIQRGQSFSFRHLCRPLPVGLVALAIVVHFSITAQKYDNRKLRHHKAPEALENLVGMAGATVAYTGWNTPYLFFGTHLQNRVLMVPTTTEDPKEEYYFWGGSTKSPFGRRGTSKTWCSNLQRLEVEVVVVELSDAKNPERTWMKRDQKHFSLMWTNGKTEIWRVALCPEITEINT
ncbi:MAG: hypothetical protein K8R59_13645 [Thermoanaerobaculales bacterium]|nr:hypothetical protein [Thermoanaerobaculales bacterium]